MSAWYENITTPAYVCDIAKLKQNLQVVARVKRETGCKIVLATKSFALPRVFPIMKEVLDGTTASGIFEARLGFEEFGKEVHVYSPAYTDDEIDGLLNYAEYFYFNSVSQHEKYKGRLKGKKLALRVNPEISQVTNNPKYDPCHPQSRFGVMRADLERADWDSLDIFHVHALCENRHDASKNLIEKVSNDFAEYVAKVHEVNFGGGHFMTHPEYNVDVLINAVKAFQDKHGVQVVLEPGAAIVLNTGYLVSSVVDIVDRGVHGKIAVTDTSATCHMPDVLEVPYTPEIDGAEITEDFTKAGVYTLAGKTCLTGDTIGTYDFGKALKSGDRLVFQDMMQYSFVKNNTFNGIPLPDLGLLNENGEYEIIHQFGYEDFRVKLG